MTALLSSGYTNCDDRPTSADTDYDPTVAYPANSRANIFAPPSLVLFDAAHGNTATPADRLGPFADVLEHDGYATDVATTSEDLLAKLPDAEVLVIAQPLSDYTPAEIDAIGTYLRIKDGQIPGPFGVPGQDATGLGLLVLVESPGLAPELLASLGLPALPGAGGEPASFSEFAGNNPPYCPPEMATCPNSWSYFAEEDGALWHSHPIFEGRLARPEGADEVVRRVSSFEFARVIEPPGALYPPWRWLFMLGEDGRKLVPVPGVYFNNEPAVGESIGVAIESPAVNGAPTPFYGKVFVGTNLDMFTALVYEDVEPEPVGFQMRVPPDDLPAAPENKQLLLNLVHWLDPYVDRGKIGGLQGPELDYEPPELLPVNTGREIVFDASHSNVHSLSGGYLGFRKVAEADGFTVSSVNEDLAACVAPGGTCANAEILAIVAPKDSDPVSGAEAAAVADWVEDGHSLLLIVDHTPYTGAGSLLAQFGLAIGAAPTVFLNGGCVPFAGACPLTIPGQQQPWCDCPTSTVDVTFDVFDRNPYHGDLDPTHPIVQGRPELTRRESVRAVRLMQGRVIDVVSTLPGVEVRSILDLPDNPLPTPEEPDPPPNTTDPLGSMARSVDYGLAEGGRVVVIGEAAVFSTQVTRGMQLATADESDQFLVNTLRWLTGVL